MSLGAKLLIDRARLPRAWVHVVPFDPDLPLRGRYVRLALEVPTVQMTGETTSPHVSPGRRFGQAKLLLQDGQLVDRKSTRLNSSHLVISYAVFCLKKKKKIT